MNDHLTVALAGCWRGALGPDTAPDAANTVSRDTSYAKRACSMVDLTGARSSKLLAGTSALFTPSKTSWEATSGIRYPSDRNLEPNCMGKIHVLPDRVANQIAAGEVVERPASVVKELLENALDAGATRIKLQVEAGGKRLIQITDNGSGMVRDDALLAFERQATSKIKDTEDLLTIATLGFRGEALPSIASVSRFRLETQAAEDGVGTVVEINGGKIFKLEDAGSPVGTSITVRDLFFNVPARKKFLKSESTELSHIASLVTHYALAHPDKHFELHSATVSYTHL